MTRKQVWRYKCDFCGKHSLSASGMNLHEKHCTMNPNRECRMHKHCDAAPKPLSDLIAIFNQCPRIENANMEPGSVMQFHVEDVGPLIDAADGCPACIFAAIRQSGFTGWVVWDFKDAVKKFWAMVNEDRAQYEHQG